MKRAYPILPKVPQRSWPFELEREQSDGLHQIAGLDLIAAHIAESGNKIEKWL